MPNEKTLLVVAAHPDDEVLGCCATVRKMVDQGWTANLVVMTAGLGGRHGEETVASGSLAGEQLELRGQLERAAAIAGYSGIDALDFPDNRMDSISRTELTLALNKIIDRVRPSLVFTHHPGDYNWDHGRTFDAVMMAGRRNPPDDAPLEIRTFEVLSSTERAWQEPSRAFHPNLYVDVTASIEAKKLAMLEYQTEYRAWPHPRCTEAIELLARRRGNEVGLEYAEAFHVVRKVEL